MSFQSDIKIVTDALTKFYQASTNPNEKVVHQEKLKTITEELNLADYSKQGGLSGAQLQRFLNIYFKHVTKLHHPHNFGHQCAAPH